MKKYEKSEWFTFKMSDSENKNRSTNEIENTTTQQKFNFFPKTAWFDH